MRESIEVASAGTDQLGECPIWDDRGLRFYDQRTKVRKLIHAVGN